jgi:type I restriction enzyme S subunit
LNWLQISIGSVCIDTETVDPQERPDTPFRYVDISSVEKDSKMIALVPEILGKDAPSRARKKIRGGDILVSTVRPNLNAVTLVPPDLDGEVASTGFCVLRPNEEKVDRRYLFYWTTTPPFVDYLVSNVRGAHYPAVSDETVKSATIPLPPLPEQRRIVEILDQADALRKLRREADAIAERILPALFYKMFGDPVQLMSSEKSIALEQLPVEIQNGFACGEKEVVGGVPHLRMNNIDDKGILNLELLRTVPREMDKETYRLKEGDVLFMGTNSEDKIGKTCLFYNPDDRNYLFSNHLIRLRATDKQLSPEYLATFLHLLWQKRFYPSIAKRWVNQSTVSQSALGKVKMFIPDQSKLELFSREYDTVMNLMKERNKANSQNEKLFSVLLHRAFTGELTKRWREEQNSKVLM